ncbi:2-succinyl-5-enolpyruvyl-6-hydroxy-3-cyclohexene-1-carboxylic-acid synthase [Lutimonas halocynthiae]|uniref:2-succinyl-5-enolpyruvyl-6-hydroxy-3- cyclohexene-1-carboxylic-acid synthase n=1 Tax=Lutimonas halocynthiae TaxID=1446477 RepID=UPI0025B341DA|nr:2-succinyl-5-enolpyruvyl-6-hydroxy-3-cyclohexene-1-carboxylic-acid synthase [Lutimonas halocynthiae]MDN3642319.1 2-succinyl-5-enolpyruvyl-6-hydroxy-3-cyclohexene-1-carboxylic-acid synthase [Lutimonas halocynthiae]
MPKYPKKKLAQLLLQACVTHNIDKVVISPGSRNAPLTLGFVNHTDISAFSIVDERCAAFFALGLAQQSGKSVALLCTSGSALLNYYPAIAEAYYSKIPLVVISADRPEHLIDIGDGQTIRQANVFSNHICFQTNLQTQGAMSGSEGQDEILAKNALKINEALDVSMERMGPVHINIPFDEPLYETVNDLYDFKSLIKRQGQLILDTLLTEEPIALEVLEKYASVWNSASKKMVLIGSNFPDELIAVQMQHLIKDPSVIILTETTSNLSGKKYINCIDQLIFPLDEDQFQDLQPDILLTFGGMVVSKRIKQFLRNHKPIEHWHIDSHRSLDTFHSLTHHFEISPQLFFSQFFFLTTVTESKYQAKWYAVNQLRKLAHKKYLSDAEFSDIKVFDLVLDSLPEVCNLQLANSSIIRYSQLFDLRPGIKVFCNRGTSGIDGSTSTAIGAALGSVEQTVLITGDISFFYDSNGLWNKYIPAHFRIILVNNNGGGIFRFIPGPKASDALDFFETTHQLNAASLCKMYDFNYTAASNENELNEKLAEFYKPSEKACLLEIFTPSEKNDLILKDYFRQLS